MEEHGRAADKALDKASDILRYAAEERKAIVIAYWKNKVAGRNPHDVGVPGKHGKA